MQQPNITPEYQECIAHAGLYTISRNQSLIGCDEMLLGIYHYIGQKDYASSFWELLGLKKEAWLQEYIATTYGELVKTSLQGTNHQLVIEHSLQQAILSGTGKTIVHLLHFSLKGASDTLKSYCKLKKIPYQKVIKRVQQLLTIITEVDVSIDDIMKQLMMIKGEHDIKLSDIDLDFLLNEQSDQGGIEQGQSIDVFASDDTNVLDGDEQQHTSTVSSSQDDGTKKKKLAVDHFGIDMTQQAKNNVMDPVIGRDKETEQVIYTLLRKTKNNPLLIGEAGVGKTAIVEGLAQRIALGNVPDRLKDKRVIMVDMSTLLAGTKYRGEFESRLKSILDEASDPTLGVILFIDEIHTLMGAGSAEGTAGDAAQMLKPALARGQIKVIGATTFDEYQKYIEKDAALKRRFQEVVVNEPTIDDTIAIISGLKARYEDFHGVCIDDKAISQAVTLSRRYILTKHLPDKAIDLLDEACARKGVTTSDLKDDQEYVQLTSLIDVMNHDIERAVAEQDYFKAAELKKEQNEHKQKLQLLRGGSMVPHHLRPTISSDDINYVTAEKIGIPVHMISESEVDKLKRLEADISVSLYGQQEVVEKISKAIRRSRLSVVSKNKPIASFLFLGPSGVGKTYTAKLIAKDYFNDEKALIRVDMSDLMERHSVSKLIGSAPGYVGYEEGGGLTEQVRRKPYSVILFDEIEKASPDVLNIMLQILDEGQIKDNKGRLIDFKNTIIIMTSNVGSEYFSHKGAKIGFGVNNNADIYANAKELVLDKLKTYFSPEWLNRIEQKIVFNPLDKAVLATIFKKHLQSLYDQWTIYHDISLPEYNDEKIAQIVESIYDPMYGARPIETYVYSTVEEELINQLMK